MYISKVISSFVFSVLLAVFSVLAIAGEPSKVNINEASAEYLAESLSGVGVQKAERIVAYRDAQGAFTDVTELANIKGIGAKIIERNMDVITLE